MRRLTIILLIIGSSFAFATNEKPETNGETPIDIIPDVPATEEIVDTSETCNESFTNIEDQFSEVTKVLKSEGLKPSTVLESFAKCFGFTYSENGVEKITSNKRKEFLEAMNDLDSTAISSLVKFMEEDIEIYEETCRQIREEKGIRTVDHAVRKVVQSQNEKIRQKEEIDQLIENKGEQEENSLWKNLYGNVAKEVNQYLAKQDEARKMRELEAMAAQENAYAQVIAQEEALTEQKKILNKYGLFSPTRRDRASVQTLVQAQTEIEGHVNSYRKQAVQFREQSKVLRAKLDGNMKERLELKQKLEAQMNAQIVAAEKIVKDAKAQYDALSASHEGSVEATNAKVSYEKALREYNELKQNYETGALQQQINAQLDKGDSTDQEIMMQIAALERNSMAAEAKAQTLAEASGQVQAWIYEKQDEEEYNVQRDRERRYQEQERIERNGFSRRSGLIPTRGGRTSYSRNTVQRRSRR